MTARQEAVGYFRFLRQFLETHFLLDEFWLDLATVRHRFRARGWLGTLRQHWHGVSPGASPAKHVGERQGVGILR